MDWSVLVVVNLEEAILNGFLESSFLNVQVKRVFNVHRERT